VSAEKFRSGTSGEVSGIRHTTRALLLDALADSRELLTLRRWRLARAAALTPRRRVLVLAIESERPTGMLAAARAELERSRHEVRFLSRGAGEAGKFENLSRLLEQHPASGYDWLLVVDDDVALPPGFLDAFIFLAERWGLQLAQPAHRRRSHAAWQVTRRRAGSVVRETRFVEIGPVFGAQASTFDRLLPFPSLRFGWGLDAHWGAIAREHGWRVGIIDAVAVAHGFRKVAAGYDHAVALAEADAFLASRPHISSAEAQETLSVHRRWR
jgi:GT2 family glycosyltransferase